MAHKKGGGSAKNLSKNNPAYRGVKKFDGEFVQSGNILIRQCGTRIHPGINVGLGRDYTIFAVAPGFVKYENRPGGRKTVSVYPTHPNRPGLEVKVIEVAEDDEGADSIEVSAN